MKGFGLGPVSSCFKERFPFNIKGNFLVVRDCLTGNKVIPKAPGREYLEAEVRVQPLKDTGEKCSAEWKVELEDI